MIEIINDLEQASFEINYNLEIYINNPFVNYMFYVINNRAVGYIIYEDLYDRYEIDYIFVDKKYRRCKIATKLLENLFNIGKEKNILNITLEVKETNYSAINLYNKLGFISKAVRKNYYKDTDGILMEKEMM